MRVYVAGKWQEKDRIRRIMDNIEELGHIISYDWTQHKDGDDGYYCASTDKQGVLGCDIVIAIVDKPYNYRGLYVEIGMALALNKPVYLYGSEADSCVFSHLCKKILSIEGLLI